MSGNTYTVRYVFYRDCAGIAAPTSVPLVTSPSIGNVSLPRISFSDVSLLCPGQLSRCASTSGVPGIEEHIYQGNINLPNAANYTLSVVQGARNAAITTLSSPGSQNMYLSTTLNTLLAPGNSSPNFLNRPIGQFCLGTANSVSPNGSDANGDVVTYSLVAARQAAGTNVTYAAGFSGLNPLTSSTGVTINPNTGVISFTPSAVATQVAVIAVRAEEFRVIAGVSTKIGEVYRDLQVRFISCSGNSAPVLSAIPNAIVQVGQNYCATINATDAVSQTISLTAVASILPPATFTILSSGAGFTNGEFCFTPSAIHQGNTYTISINAQDNFCPTPSTAVRTFNITVPAPCNVSVNSSSTAATCGVSDGTATATLTGGTPPYQYSWTGPGGFTSFDQTSISALAPGTYHVNISDAFQCAAETDIIVGGGPAVQITANITNTTCGNNNGSIDATASAGTPPYIFQWDNGQTTSTATGLDVGIYILYVTDATGCVGSSTFIVNPDADGTPPTALCNDATVTLDGLGDGNLAAIMVDNGSSDNCSITTMSLSKTSFNCSDVGQTTVILTVQDAAGNSSSCPATITIVDETAPYYVNCYGTTLVLDANGIATLSASDIADISEIYAHEACGIASITLSQTDFDCSHIGLNSVTLTATDVNGNSVSCIASVMIKDLEVPVISCPPTIRIYTDPGMCTSSSSIGNATATDNCGATVDVSPAGPYYVGITTVTWTATDGSGNTATCTQDVEVRDGENPTVSCPGNISQPANASGCSRVVNYSVTYNDNCSATIAQTAGLPSGSAFPRGTTTNCFKVTDVAGNIATCCFTITVTSNLSINAGSDEQTYYGYVADQTVVRTALATGGGGTYSYAWGLSRPLMCNVVNSNGDETFTAGSCINNICPGVGSPLIAPSCSGTATVTTKLIEDANLYATVSDQFGCVARDTFNIKSVDARCYAGNSGNVKVNVCHKTSSATNPWVQICIAQAAVPTHLAENNLDYIGKCGAKLAGTDRNPFDMVVYPNPANDLINIEFESETSDNYYLAIFDITGRIVLTSEGKTFAEGNRISLPVNTLASGVYSIKLMVGEVTSLSKFIVSK